MQAGLGKSLILIIGVLALVAAAFGLGARYGKSGSGPDAPPAALPAETRAGEGSARDREAEIRVPAAKERVAVASSANAPKQGREGISFTHFRVGERNVKAMLSDGDVLWVGTSGGVVRYDLTTDEHRLFDVRAGLLSNGIFHLSKLGERLVVGTYGGGLSLLDPTTERWENYNIQNGLADAFVYDFLELRNGDVWIATWSGANLIRGGDLSDLQKWETFTVENTAAGLPNDWVYGLAEGKNGEVWMATEGGLARFAGGQWSNWNHKDGMGAPYDVVRNQITFTRDPAKESSHHARQKQEMGLMDVDVAYNPNYIVALLVDEDGTVWCGTWGGGLAHFDGKTWTNYTVRDGLPANHVFMLGHQRNGDLWVGTSDGLARFDRKRFEVYNTNDGLFAKSVFSMTYGEDGSLWLGSYGGVANLKGIDRVP